MEVNHNVVSLESNVDGNFYEKSEFEVRQCSYGVYQVRDSIAIEDIIGDEGGEMM